MSNAMTGKVESINISKASTTTNLFYLFFHGGKAAIIPFLTIFFRLVGLNALEAGTVIAVKTLTGLVWAPLWARCATAYSRHRLVLVISLFMMIMTYLAFPALYTQLATSEHCLQVSSSNHSPDLPPHSSSHDVSHTTKPPETHPPTQTPGAIASTSSSTPSTDGGHNSEQTATPITQEAALENTTTQPWTSSETSLTDTSAVSLKTNAKPYLYERLVDILHKIPITIEEFTDVKLTQKQLSDFLQSKSPDSFTEDQISELYEWLQLQANNPHRKVS